MPNRILALPAVLALLLAAGALAGCGLLMPAAPPPPETAEPARPTGRPGLTLPQILAGEQTPTYLVSQLFEPLSERRQLVANRHVEGQTDTVRTLVYNDLEITLYAVADGPVFVQEVKVTGDEYATVEGLRVGDTLAAFEEEYGPATDVDGRDHTFPMPGREGDAYPPTVTVHLRSGTDAGGGRVSSITWSFPID